MVGYPIAPDVLTIIPEEIATRHQVIPYMRVGGLVRIATTRPIQPETKQVLERLHSKEVKELTVTLCSKSSFMYGVNLYQALPKVERASGTVNVTEEKEHEFTLEMGDLGQLKRKLQSASTTNVLDFLFAGAVLMKATDIHLDPSEKDIRVRFRIDGVLAEIVSLDKAGQKAVDSRIKFLAKMRLDKGTGPQDGRFGVAVQGSELDIRASALPTSFGDAFVLRLLTGDIKELSLAQLGMRPDAIKVIEEAISKPQGIIFNTGPTGSGKTTTLYAILKKLNTPERKIITLEDPIEYRIEGVEQVQVSAEKHLSFSDGLRAILRQDPDIVMVGEVRDPETAKTAMQAAMTGHLVLTTLHTNNAPAALPRLVEMGVDPFLLTGTINLIIAQRLVRKLCTQCGGKGCKVCRGTGFSGRVAIVEVLKPTPEFEELVTQKAPLSRIIELARKQGMMTMEEDGMEKVKAGVTTKEEIWRVTKT